MVLQVYALPMIVPMFEYFYITWLAHSWVRPGVYSRIFTCVTVRNCFPSPVLCNYFLAFLFAYTDVPPIFGFRSLSLCGTPFPPVRVVFFMWLPAFYVGLGAHTSASAGRLENIPTGSSSDEPLFSRLWSLYRFPGLCSDVYKC